MSAHCPGSGLRGRHWHRLGLSHFTTILNPWSPWSRAAGTEKSCCWELPWKSTRGREAELGEGREVKLALLACEAHPRLWPPCTSFSSPQF